jgi:shikimate dehydrogenase
MIRLGLLGFPVEHSLSPRMHRAALAACGLEGEYTLYPVQEGDRAGLDGVLEQVRSGTIQGLNVTIPHKRAMADLVDRLTADAEAIGAVNTVRHADGWLEGENTDARGFLRDLQVFLDANGRSAGDGQPALVLGAGGAARAVTHALLGSGWQVAVAARRVEQAHQLAGHFADGDVRVVDYAELSSTAVQPRIADTALLVNATPIGMAPVVDASPWPAGLPFPRPAALYDLVYAPEITVMVRNARAAGLPATTGLGMLAEQACLSFAWWTGRTPSRDVMLSAVR